MSFFSSKGNSAGEQVVAVFDVGSGSIGAAVVVVSPVKLPYIVWNKRIPITFQNKLTYDQLSKTMLAALLDISLDLQTNGLPLLSKLNRKPALDDAFFAFASPWYSMQAKVFKIEKDEKFEITETFLHNLVKKEIKEFMAGADKGGDPAATPVLIEQKVIQTALNGYVVSDPFDKPAKRAQIDLVLSVIPSYIHSKASEIKTQLTNSKEEGAFHSFILPAFSVTRDVLHGNTSFLQIDVSAEVTDVATVHRGTIIDATSFPYGKHYIIRGVAEKFDISSEQSMSMLRTYMNGESDISETEKIRGALVDLHNTWLTEFQDTLRRISVEVPLPKDIYLTVDDDFGQWFKQAILAGDFSEYALSKTPFRITHLSAEKLKEYVAHSKLTTEPDPFLTLEAIYLQRELYHL